MPYAKGDAAPLCVELHDAAPATWEDCERLLAMIDGVARIPISLLVVPDYHHCGQVIHSPKFIEAIGERVSGGDEISLHGYHHQDEGPPVRGPIEWFRRRVRTLSEGELAATDQATTVACIARGLDQMTALGWNVSGFVAPAWLLGDEARSALGAFSFAYTAVREGFYRLPEWTFVPTATLSYAAFTRFRRVLSRPALDYQLAHAPPHRALRLALHPVDARHPRVLGHWRALLERALEHRVPMSAAAFLRREHPEPIPSRIFQNAPPGVATLP